MELLALSIGLGLVISLLLTETLGVASAGMVVPGYLALYLGQPLHLASTGLATLVTYGAVRLLGTVALIYGRRRTAIAILVGYLMGATVSYFSQRFFLGVEGGLEAGDDSVIGYIIPGLIAIWMDRQGIIETLGALTICSVAVRLLLIVVLGVEVTG